LKNQRLMSQGEAAATGDRPKGDSLAAYRRLIALQRQMIVIGQQHEQSKRECDALRAQMTQAASARRRNGKSVSHRLRESAVRLLRRVPGLLVATNPVKVFKTKQPHN